MMYYYKKNIGDYYKKTGRLSMLEHGAYTLLIDACYDRERFPTLEDALDWTWSRSDAEIEAVKFVLSKFFTLNGDIYIQSRIHDELNEYHAMSERNSIIAKEREEKRRQRKRNDHDSCSSGEPIVNETPPNQEPRTKNQEPLTNKPIINDSDESESENEKPFMFKSELKKLGVDEKSATEFMAVRKAKKARNTERAFNSLLSEIQNSGLSASQAIDYCLDRQSPWGAFKNEWYSNEQRGNKVANNGYQTAQQQTAAEQEKWRLACEPQNNFIDVSPVDQWKGFLNESN